VVESNLNHGVVLNPLHCNVKQVSREKAYVLNNIFLKFSQLTVLDNNDDDHRFSNNFGATSKAILAEFFTPEDI